MSPIASLEPETELFVPEQETDCVLRKQVWSILATLYPVDMLERRQHDRYAYPRLLKVTPISAEGQPTGETFIVAGKHLSERGLGFYHPGPLPHKWVQVSLQHDHGQWVEFYLNLTWCKFVSHGWYESGGWFVNRMQGSARQSALTARPPARGGGLAASGGRQPEALSSCQSG